MDITQQKVNIFEEKSSQPISESPQVEAEEKQVLSAAEKMKIFRMRGKMTMPVSSTPAANSRGRKSSPMLHRRATHKTVDDN